MYQLDQRGLAGVFVTPKAIQEYVLLLDSRIHVFDVDVQKSPPDCLDPQFLLAWGSFRTRWANWMNSVSWVDRLWLSTQETAEQFAVELNTFLPKFAAACDREPSIETVAIPGDKPDQLTSLGKSMVWVAGGALAIYASFKFLQNASWAPRRRRAA